MASIIGPDVNIRGPTIEPRFRSFLKAYPELSLCRSRTAVTPQAR